MDAHPFVGIDVSKERLDIGVGEAGAFWQAGNDEAGIHSTVERLAGIQPVLVVVESTGGLEWPLVSELAARRIGVALVHPGRVREFAKSLGLLAKTDKLDAHLLARFGEAAHLQPTLLPDETVQKLSALMGRRRQLLGRIKLNGQSPGVVACAGHAPNLLQWRAQFGEFDTLLI